MLSSVQVRAISDFQGVSFLGFQELTFSLGTSLFLLEIDERAGWAKGSLGEQVGWFPISFVELADNDNTLKDVCLHLDAKELRFTRSYLKWRSNFVPLRSERLN
jgi:hypothetical protein